MPDVFTKEKRSLVMAAIKGRGNLSTELRFITLMREAKIKGWRRNYRLEGRPDFVFPRQKIVVFVDGTFWHGHPSLCRIPATNRLFWLGKIAGNRRRDRRIGRLLRSRGWKVIRIWEHDLAKHPSYAVKRVLIALSECDGRSPVTRGT